MQPSDSNSFDSHCFLQGLCAQSFYGHLHSVNFATFNLKVCIKIICVLIMTFKSEVRWLVKIFLINLSLSEVYNISWDPVIPDGFVIRQAIIVYHFNQNYSKKCLKK